MIRKLFFVILLLIITNSIYSQNRLNNLNGYKYIGVSTIQYNDGSYDKYGIVSQIKEIFHSKGFMILTGNESITEIPVELINNPNLLLSCHITHNDFIYHTVSISLIDSKGDVIFSGNGEGKEGSRNRMARIATTRALRQINNFSYSYNPELTPKIHLPTVEKIDESEQSIKEYLDSNNLDPIEGIYKSYKTDVMSHYKFGIIKKNGKFKAIIIESEFNHWLPGEVKAIAEKSSKTGFYSIKWYLSDKTSQETFGYIEDNALLVIELRNPTTGEKENLNFVKLYPKDITALITNPNKPISSGSGFFISKDGIIATNAHVVDNSSKIEITFSNELGRFTYDARILLIDKKNDVALVKIEDNDFQGLNFIPFSINEKANIGESVFTIGYPLNEVMGNNFKVTNGIISSNTGIGDDLRYFQITVPIQPGNSGGPLFNKDGDVIGITSSRLNSDAIGIKVENVNYAIKSSYLLNIINMLPVFPLGENKQELKNISLEKQVGIIKNYVCLIRVY